MRDESIQYLAPSAKTQLRIVEAFEQLLETESFDDVTIANICAEVGMSRGTFYYHFKDKYDVVQWHYTFVAKRYLFEAGRTLTWYQAHYRNTYEVLKHKTLYEHAFSVRGYQSLFSYSKRQRVQALQDTVTEWKHVELDDELCFQIAAFAEADVASVGNWFRQGMPCDLETLCRFMEGVIPRRLYDLLKEPVDPQPF